jgi:UDP-N-acetylmuramoyl-tripeptide--D-alanyl-D-alanine ligase
MIALKHLKNCSSVQGSLTGIDLNMSLNFCTDSRQYLQPQAFVAIPGAKVNPLDLIQQLLNQQCPLVIYQADAINQQKVSQLSQQFPRTHFLPVSDSITFLQQLAHAHVLDWKARSPKNSVFAISGSNGKTTHKEMLAFILKSALPGKIVATEKNNNNHLGVPLTLLQINEQTELVVLELGSNHPGEIKVLCDIAHPDAGITTNIGATHLEFFGSEENVFEEEAYLFHAVKSVTGGRGFFMLNVDDPFLKQLPVTSGSITYGEAADAAARVFFHEDGASIQCKGSEYVVHNAHITGRHNKLNLITCYFIALHYYPELKQPLLRAAAEFRPTRNRSEWIEFAGKSVFLDAYNANPSSMKAALEGFKESVAEQGLQLTQACVVLGDMNELGEKAPQYHEEVGAFVKILGFTNVYFIGRYASHYQQGYLGGSARLSSSEFKPEYRNECLKNYPIHFIKGSRSLQLESLFDIT